ncbi:MAG: TonB-dependent receptor [Deltaproteobacteria bacterium]|nr:TonB-dependent receptor [Deltaproteobacteria bacterium]
MVTFPSPNVHEKELRNATTASLAVTGWPVPVLDLRTQVAHRYRHTRYLDNRGEQTGVPLRSTQDEFAPEAEQSLRLTLGTHQVVTASGQWRQEILRDEAFDDPSRTTWAAALRDQVFFIGDALTFVPAVRYDAVEDVGSQWSPKFGAAVSPWRWLTLKGNIGRSFRAPSFTELYFNQGFVEGNPDLKPERATTGDAGFQLRAPFLFFENAYFRSDVDDLIEYVLISGFRYRPVNIGEARLEGYEASGRLEPVEYFSLAGAYTLTYAIDTTDDANRNGRQIPGRPRHTAFGRAEGHWRYFTPFVEHHYVGGNYVTAANTKLLPERRLWNAGLVTRPDDVFSVGFEIKNLSDEQAVDVRGFPLPGRAIFITAEAAF